MEDQCRDLNIPFPSAREAEIAYNTLCVDRELKRSNVHRHLTLKDAQLHVHYEAQEAKCMRVGVNSFMDHLSLVLQTVDQFGPPVQDQR